MKRSIVWMAACCLVPLALTLAVTFLSLRSSHYWLVSLITPILMAGSLWAMHAPESDLDQKKQEVRNR